MLPSKMCPLLMWEIGALQTSVAAPCLVRYMAPNPLTWAQKLCACGGGGGTHGTFLV